MKVNNAVKWILVWLLALLITAGAMIYQHFTGPTKPKRVELMTNEGDLYKIKLPRSHGGTRDCEISLLIPDTAVAGVLFYRTFPTNDAWDSSPLVRKQDSLIGYLPNQPPAGKLEYYLTLHKQSEEHVMPMGEKVIIRFRGDVPAGIIIPHASLMFISMLLSNLTLLLAIFGFRQYRLYGYITTAVLFVGGLILGPLVQKYAFGQLWTGFPVGYDLTDNKTLIAFFFWMLAVLGSLGKERRYLTVLAGLVMLVIFSIPHSARGSERDPHTGEIKTGMVINTIRNK